MVKTYPAILFVARHGRRIAIVVGCLLALIAIALYATGAGGLATLAVGIAVAVVGWAVTRVAAEVVEVVAETLLPR